MMPLEFADWDHGRLHVNCSYAELFQRHRLTTFARLYDYQIGDVVRRVDNRVTMRIELSDENEVTAFYLKRHGRASFADYLRPICNLRWPILGAANEWSAILKFHELGLPTMEPVVLGVNGRRSFLITKSLEGHQSLLEWLQSCASQGQPPDSMMLRQLISELAAITRQMHAAGIHHQDFYLNHLLIPKTGASGIRVIDLGRVCQRAPLTDRWIIKDLAQLDYSSRLLSAGDRLRFLRTYLDRTLSDNDLKLIRRIKHKSRLIDRHTRKHGL